MEGKEKELEFMLRSRFGSMIRKARKKKKISQERLSEVAGISTVYLRSLEKGEYTATWLIWIKICTFLDINISELQDMICSLFMNDDYKSPK